MKKITRSLASVAAALGLAGAGLVAAPAAQAADLTCSGIISGRTMTGDITVPEGATCTIRSSTVTADYVYVAPNATLITENSSVSGFISVERGATLRATEGSLGDVLADSQKLIRIHGTSVGSLNVSQGGTVTTTRMRVRDDAYFYGMGGTVSHSWGRFSNYVSQYGSARNRFMIRSSVVGADVSVQQSGHVLVGRNTVYGNIFVHDNRGTVYIEGNRADLYLSCDGNRYQPTGGNNTAWDKWGQCASL
ncbi:hypothetical protein I6H91_07560 [Micrococcus luteus]|uniref:hypothetical protein n=1 Tax=Micrococcus luteus TaxID=1270 RepID=UPI0019100C1C|nr:hypothetical protein [Micrococcus luteus]QQE48034.1 hypothetical protein I6H91_07560 [Micrococcus luteus]